MLNRLCLLALAFLVAAGPAAAFLDPGRTLDQVTTEADLIVHGRVASAEARWVSDERGTHIYTYAVVDLIATWKGQDGTVLTVEFPGGQVGSIREVVSDRLPVAEGDEVVLFLKGTAPRLFAGPLGHFKIEQNHARGSHLSLPTESLFQEIQRTLGNPASNSSADTLTGTRTVIQVANAGRGPIPGNPEPASKILSSGPVATRAGSVLSQSADAEELVFYDGFEETFPGEAWSLMGSPTWGITTYSAALGSKSAWCAGSSMTPAEGYAPSMDSWMIHGPFSLAGVAAGKLDFSYRNGSEAGVDEFWWLASTDGSNFYGYKISGSQNTWRAGQLDFTNVPTLGNITGSTQVWIAFSFTSDPVLSNGAGAFVDEVYIRRGTPGTSDLIMEAWQIPPANAIEGSAYWVKGEVGNLGPGTAGASKVRLYLSPTNDSNIADDYYVGEEDVPQLAAGTSTWVTWDFTVPDLGSGTYNLWPVFVVDTDNQVDETDEDNLFPGTSSLTVMPAGTGTPVIAAISPSTASAGTGSSVSISGSGFGSLQGQSSVDFFYRSGQPKIPADCSTWSNTLLVCTVPIADVNDYPASASSGPVTVTTGGGTSLGYTFPVTFGYGEVRWPGESTTFQINENAPSCTGEGAAVQAATESWNAAGSRFRFDYDGATTATTATHDFTNQITWGNTEGSIATAYYWMTATNIIEADIVFNTDFAWSTADTVPGDSMDVQTIALHELGHWLSLRDLYGNIGDGHNDTAKVMYGFGSYGLKKRELTAEDQAGIQYIYGTGLRITGHVQVDGGAGLAGVSMTGFPTSVTTLSDGSFTAPVPDGWSGEVTPVKQGYEFDPSTRSFTNVTVDTSDQDFTAIYNQPSVQGVVTNTRGRGVPGVKVTLTNKGGKTFTDGQGVFIIPVKSGWSGRVSVSRSGVSFLTATKTLNNVTAPVTGQDFVAKDVTLSGKAKNRKGRGLAGVTITFISTTGEDIDPAITGSNGSYSLSVPLMWSGTATPSLAGVTFTPAMRSFNGLYKNSSRQDFKTQDLP